MRSIYVLWMRTGLRKCMVIIFKFKYPILNTNIVIAFNTYLYRILSNFLIMRSFILLCIFTLLSIPSFAQINWAPIGSTWYYSYSNPNPNIGSYMKITSIKDTSVNFININYDRSCVKIYS